MEDSPIMAQSKEAYLRDFLETNASELLRVFGHYVIRMNLACYEDLSTLASEILNDVVVEAFQHIERLQSPENPAPWLIGIGLNIIKRRVAEQVRLHQREPLLSDFGSSDTLDDLLIGHLLNPSSSSDHLDLLRQLTHLSWDEKRVIELAVLHSLNSDEIGQELGISAGAVRVRLHRALKHARQLLGTREGRP